MNSSFWVRGKSSNLCLNYIVIHIISFLYRSQMLAFTIPLASDEHLDNDHDLFSIVLFPSLFFCRTTKHPTIIWDGTLGGWRWILWCMENDIWQKTELFSNSVKDSATFNLLDKLFLYKNWFWLILLFHLIMIMLLTIHLELSWVDL